MLDNAKTCIELGVAKLENVPEPLKPRTSCRDENRLSNAPASLSGNAHNPNEESPTNAHSKSTSQNISEWTEPDVADRRVSLATISETSRTSNATVEFSHSSQQFLVASPDDEPHRSRRKCCGDVCCCFHAVRMVFLRCLEETPLMVSGLVLAILFCVTIIIIIPSTGRVRAGRLVKG